LIKTGLCFLFFCIHCINRSFKHAGLQLLSMQAYINKNSRSRPIEYCPIDVIFNQQYVQQKYFISKYKTGDAGTGRRKNIVPDSQGASWRTCDDVNRPPIKAQRRKTSGYTRTTNEEMGGTLCSRINCLESDVLHEFENDTEDIPRRLRRIWKQ